MKDLMRGRGAEANWPDSLKAARIGGRQRVGGGRVLEFVPYAEGQTDPFYSSFVRSSDLNPVAVQSLSLPLPAKSLGRKDESWLIQVAVALKVIETHFALGSHIRVLELTHLQTGVKLSSSEVDALFLALVERNDGSRLNALVTCEAKQDNERILEHQIVSQIIAAYRSVKRLKLQIELIVPIAIQASKHPEGSIYVVEFQPWSPAQAEVSEDEVGHVVMVREGLYQIRPPVRGIGYSGS